MDKPLFDYLQLFNSEILRLLQRSLTSAALTALAEWEDRDMMVAADRNYVIDYFEVRCKMYQFW